MNAPDELPEPLPIVGGLPGEMIPDAGAEVQVWRVRSFSPDGTTPTPCHGCWPAFTAGEALQRTVAQARAEGWPVAALRWSVTLAHEAAP